MNKRDQKRIPTYELLVDEEFELSGMDQISIVKRPAIEVQGYAFAGEEGLVHPNCNCYIDDEDNFVLVPSIGVDGEQYPCDKCEDAKVKWDRFGVFKDVFGNAVRKSLGRQVEREVKRRRNRFEQFASVDQQIIAGPVAIPNKLIPRKAEDGSIYNVFFSEDTCIQLAAKFLKSNRNTAFNFEHSNVKVKAHLMGIWLIGNPEMDKSRLYGFNDLPKNTIFIEVKIEDEKFWKNYVKEKGVKSFSLEGYFAEKMLNMSAVTNFDEFDELLFDAFNEMNDDEIIDLVKLIDPIKKNK